MAAQAHDDLAEQRGKLLEELAGIGDLRQGSLRAQYRKCGKPNCHCAVEGARGHGPYWLLTWLDRETGKSRGPHHSRRCHRRNAGPDRGVPEASRAGARAGRGQRPDMRCEAGRGQAGRAGKKGGLGSAIAAEVEAEVERLIGAGVVEDFQAIETEARRVALQIMGQAIAHRLNADHSDARGTASALRVRRRGALRRASAQDLHHRSWPTDAGACLVSLRQLPRRLQPARPRARHGRHLPVAGGAAHDRHRRGQNQLRGLQRPVARTGRPHRRAEDGGTPRRSART